MHAGRGRVDRLQRVLLISALCYGLVYAGVAASDQWKYRRGKPLIATIVPGRAIIVEVWPLAVLSDRFNPYSYAFFTWDPDATNERWVGIWYQDMAAGTRKRLAAFTLPTWPLTISTAGLWLILATAVCARRTRRNACSSSKWEM